MAIVNGPVTIDSQLHHIGKQAYGRLVTNESY